MITKLYNIGELKLEDLVGYKNRALNSFGMTQLVSKFNDQYKRNIEDNDCFRDYIDHYYNHTYYFFIRLAVLYLVSCIIPFIMFLNLDVDQ